MKTIVSYAFVVGAMLMAVSCGSKKSGKEDNQRDAMELSGAGATFPQPFYNAIFETFSHQNGDQVAYGGIGSGGGVRNLKDKVVDFAGSDAFLNDKEMAEMPAVIHVPSCMGAVVLAYNLPDVKSLNLSGEVVAEIYAGVIRRWNDAKIKQLNPDVKLPDNEIIPAYRSDGSGTTFVFTDYLSKVSPSWKATYGAGKSVNFPIGQAAKGNPGVAATVAQTPYAIGYIGSEYAFAQDIAYAKMQNANGEMVEPNPTSISAAAAGDIPADTRTSITNSSAPGAYPISTFTWLIIYKEQNYANRTLEQAKATLDLLNYVLSDEAQKMTSKLHYAPLPKKAIELSKENLKKVTYDNRPIL